MVMDLRGSREPEKQRPRYPIMEAVQPLTGCVRSIARHPRGLLCKRYQSHRGQSTRIIVPYLILAIIPEIYYELCHNAQFLCCFSPNPSHRPIYAPYPYGDIKLFSRMYSKSGLEMNLVRPLYGDALHAGVVPWRRYLCGTENLISWAQNYLSDVFKF